MSFQQPIPYHSNNFPASTLNPQPSLYTSISPPSFHTKPPQICGSLTRSAPSISRNWAREWNWKTWVQPSWVLHMEPNIIYSPACLAFWAASRVANTPPVFYVLMFTAWATFFILSRSCSLRKDSSARIFMGDFYFIAVHCSMLLMARSKGCSIQSIFLTNLFSSSSFNPQTSSQNSPTPHEQFASTIIQSPTPSASTFFNKSSKALTSLLYLNLMHRVILRWDFAFQSMFQFDYREAVQKEKERGAGVSGKRRVLGVVLWYFVSRSSRENQRQHFGARQCQTEEQVCRIKNSYSIQFFRDDFNGARIDLMHLDISSSSFNYFSYPFPTRFPSSSIKTQQSPRSDMQQPGFFGGSPHSPQPYIFIWISGLSEPTLIKKLVRVAEVE